MLKVSSQHRTVLHSIASHIHVTKTARNTLHWCQHSAILQCTLRNNTLTVLHCPTLYTGYNKRKENCSPQKAATLQHTLRFFGHLQ